MLGKIVGKGKGKGSSRQGGFTVVELAVSILLVGISLSVVTLAYASSRRSMLITSGTDEVESLMRRAYNIAMQEGVDVYLQFWDASGSHPNRCAIYRVYPDGRDERDNDEPTETPPPGVSADTDGEGHFWFKIAEGSVSVQRPVTLLFRREGALVTVSSDQGGMSVTITLSGLSRTITINERGEVSS